MLEKNFKVTVMCGSILTAFGVLLFWGVFRTPHLFSLWPGSILGLCFSLTIPYLVIRASKQKTAKHKTKESAGSNLGGLGAGLGILFLAVFHEQEAFTANVAAAAASMLLGIGFFFIMLALLKKSGKL